MLSPTVLLRQATLLVVDDEEALRLYMCRVLQDVGYRVLTARDGISALTLLQQSRFPVQLVITDVCMPRMTGPELAARIATAPFPPPLCFVSGGHSYPDLPGPVLRKPFRPDDLTATVRWMLPYPSRSEGPPARRLVSCDVSVIAGTQPELWRSCCDSTREIA
jgi:CheY-like chemotaxis protein